MTLLQISKMFQRAFAHTFEKKKFYFLFATLALSGIFILFFQGLALFTEGWWKTSLDFFPLFITFGFVLAAEVVLVRLYASQIKGERPLMRRTLGESWELMLRISYLALPLLLTYLLFWILSGVFLLLKAIPVFGTPLGVILSVAPFLLNLGTILLVVSAFFIAFYLCPRLALEKSFDRRTFFAEIKDELFFVILFFLIDLIPIWLVYQLLTYAARLTFAIESLEAGTLEGVLQSFFMMLPFLAILTPAMIFFFNFSVEVVQTLQEYREAHQKYV
ncbi:MAG: hypothetical protein S4CHLAM45_14600 [Chlamydiales bacterium]|nr:hypothetical protein [Chlamydiales bacterium]MCH9620578.1 hypothetical protein [Chlamydiales bacterium]MCH9623550.1 hypothetical protein [Chlamydiales bacterium]